MYSPESSVRKTGSYIYEEFMPTDGTDVKVGKSVAGGPKDILSLGGGVKTSRKKGPESSLARV